jgi:hypothetical protein
MTSRQLGFGQRFTLAGMVTNSIFANNPFIEGLFEWMDSPEGQQSIAVRDVLWDLLEGVQVDAKQRQLIWPGAKRTARKERLDLDQSVQRIQKMCPEFPGGEIEEFLLDWIDMGYDPENYSQAQLDELDKLTERWVADHRRKAKTSKKHKRTRHSCEPLAKLQWCDEFSTGMSGTRGVRGVLG